MGTLPFALAPPATSFPPRTDHGPRIARPPRSAYAGAMGMRAPSASFVTEREPVHPRFGLVVVGYGDYSIDVLGPAGPIAIRECTPRGSPIRTRPIDRA